MWWEGGGDLNRMFRISVVGYSHMTIAKDKGKQHSGINDMYFEIQARKGREDQIIRTQYPDTCSVSYLTPRYYVYFFYLQNARRNGR
jgi:hypothetical protein